MGLLDNNKVLTREETGLEGTNFKLLSSNDSFDIWEWDKTDSQKNLRVTYRDICVWSDANKLYMIKGKITDTPTEIEVNTTNFPNLRSFTGGGLPTIDRVIACPCDLTYQNGNKYYNQSKLIGIDCRICVIFTNGQIYHNYPSCYNDSDYYRTTIAKQGESATVESMFFKFDESVVWDLPNRKHPVKTNTGDDATLIATGMYYYNPSLPDNAYEFHPALSASNGYGNTVGFGATNDKNIASSGTTLAKRARFWRINMDDSNSSSFHYMGGYALDLQSVMIGTYNDNNSTKPCRICVFGTQDGGRSWYAMYEFAARDRLKRDSSYVTVEAAYGIPMAQIGSVSSGVYAIKRRSLVIPTATTKEPSTLFDYGETVEVSGITGTSEDITFTTTSAHGLNNGDCVVVNFQENISANNRTFDWMVNPTADGTTGGNGIMFKVKDVTANTFKVTMYVWNPDNNIPVRHVHALNRCKDGLAVSCGETYPTGGWIFYLPIKLADAHAGYNVADYTTNTFVRLNSTVDSFQRPLGVILQQEGKDTYLYIGVDNEFTPMNDVTMPEGRSQTFKHNSCGVWKCKLDEIDSQKDNGTIKLNARQVCYCLQKMDNAMVFTGQLGAFALSYDDGESWTCLQLPMKNNGQSLANFSGLTHDRMFSINNILVQLKK